jgi:hypothetical protein
MSDSWTISVAGRPYGPYSGEQLQVFAAEGRLARQSLVARAGQTDFRRADDEPELAALFSPPPVAVRAVAQTLRRDEPAGFGRGDDQSRSGGRSRLVVIADMKSGSISKLEEEIATLGPTCTLLPQVWLLTTEVSVNTVRNLLVQQIGKLDMLFVVDASNDKAAWFNFGPEADARIRKLWRSEPKLRAVG